MRELDSEKIQLSRKKKKYNNIILFAILGEVVVALG